MRSTETLQMNVIDELAFDPQVDSSDIAITVQDSTVTLGGHVRSYVEKLAAERAARRVTGVKGVIDNIEVRLDKAIRDRDSVLVANALTILRWNSNVPADSVKVVVQNGWIKLEGEVNWNFQKQAAENAVRHMPGLKGVMNHIKVTPAVATVVVGDQIKSAFRRNAEFDATQIQVTADGSIVTLAGTVRSWTERRAAEEAAWAAPGVSEVTNTLTIEPVPAVTTW
jgi:osmotically-inducible protein OsmY